MVEVSGVKFARICAKAVYPPVSAWEFRALKTEQVIKDRLQGSTVYFIVQRPMLWFDNVRLVHAEGRLAFDITGGTQDRMVCSLQLADALRLSDLDDIEVSFEFHRDARNDLGPLRNVASIRVFKKGQFLAWWSPHKILFDAATRGLPLCGTGDVQSFTDYDVHYIGQAYSQRIWKRLTKHEKLQEALTAEFIRGDSVQSVSLEIALIMLEITSIQEQAIDARFPFLIPDGVAPIFHRFETAPPDARWIKFHNAWMGPSDRQATNELEAMLIHMYQPKYNSKMYDNYPNIGNGARSLGYTETDVALTDFPFTLRGEGGVVPLRDAE